MFVVKEWFCWINHKKEEAIERICEFRRLELQGRCLTGFNVITNTVSRVLAKPDEDVWFV